MQYEIKGEGLPVVVVTLGQGEQIVTESGGMSWMSGNLLMETNMKGGLLGGLSRALAGDTVFLNTYTAQGGPGFLACASSFPGQILTFDLGPGQSVIAQRGAFLCGSPTLKLSVHMRRSLGMMMFGGEGFVLERIEGPGRVFLEVDGSVEKLVLQPGQTMIVDPGHIAAYSPNLTVSLETVKGFKNIFLGGEGLFICRVTGPGELFLQTLTASKMAAAILPFIPKSSS